METPTAAGAKSRANHDNSGIGSSTATFEVVSDLVAHSADPFSLDSTDLSSGLREEMQRLLVGGENESDLTTVVNDVVEEQKSTADDFEEERQEKEASAAPKGFQFEESTPKFEREPFYELETDDGEQYLVQGETITETEEVRRVQISFGEDGIKKDETFFSRPISEYRIVNSRSKIAA